MSDISKECWEAFEAALGSPGNAIYPNGNGYRTDSPGLAEKAASWTIMLAGFATAWKAREDEVLERDFLLRRIMHDLPARRDWLDPAIERAARKLLEASDD